MAVAKHKWFKFWANDFLGDPDVDNTPDGAMLLVIKMWCICCLEGSCPADVKEIARKTRVGAHYVSNYESYFGTYFERRGDRLFSKRMERDRARSEAARQSVANRWNKGSSGNGSTERTGERMSNRNTKRNTPESQKAREPESQQYSLTDRFQESSAVVSPVEIVEIVENVPRGAGSQSQNHEFPGMSLQAIDQRRRMLKEQAQNLSKKGNVKSNGNPSLYPKAAEA